jgi:hypothetical protein
MATPQYSHRRAFSLVASALAGGKDFALHQSEWSAQAFVDTIIQRVSWRSRNARSFEAANVRRTYEFIKAHKNEYDVATMCRVLDVARAGYYAWLREPLSTRAKEDVRLLRMIRASDKASHVELRELLRSPGLASARSIRPFDPNSDAKSEFSWPLARASRLEATPSSV